MQPILHFLNIAYNNNNKNWVESFQIRNHIAFDYILKFGGVSELAQKILLAPEAPLLKTPLVFQHYTHLCWLTENITNQFLAKF